MLRGRCGELNHVLSLRRYEVAGWLRKMVGVVAGKDLPAEPSEEHFRIGLRSGIILCNVLNKIQPGAVPKPNSALSQPSVDPGAHLRGFHTSCTHRLIAVLPRPCSNQGEAQGFGA